MSIQDPSASASRSTQTPTERASTGSSSHRSANKHTQFEVEPSTGRSVADEPSAGQTGPVFHSCGALPSDLERSAPSVQPPPEPAVHRTASHEQQPRGSDQAEEQPKGRATMVEMAMQTEEEVAGFRPGAEPNVPAAAVAAAVHHKIAELSKALAATEDRPHAYKTLAHPFVLLLVLRKILLKSDGRDKVFKIAQYITKLLLWSQWLPASRVKRLEKAVSSLSICRKIIRLGLVLDPLTQLHENGIVFGSLTFRPRPNSLTPIQQVYCWLAVMNDISDDLICLSKIGVLSDSWAGRMTPVSDRLWFSTIWIDLWFALWDYRSCVKHHWALKQPSVPRKAISGSTPLPTRPTAQPVEKDLKQSRERLFMAKLQILKLLADGLFCGLDVFYPSKPSGGSMELTQLCAALVSGAAGTYKLWTKSEL
ncbi:peroxisomal biogenesis factor 11-domain-containing protein [Polychytrium aggregatum]|uniref:peroxisomal biogenesis factor 11-domain-containing protein n=1 Tax=Polychytrium aggregatum TaxID=110093 RepID=UPI0022FE7360|nr:peroxisomal biogenesis factor 11-domain-containing protein [Polychytrium aggregatum]KAI9209889.1 peroxisomal biogenesis factor 11-domain-containing protein [Polychytrium aggregatum]